MEISSGFFNAVEVNGVMDRTYNAEDFGNMLHGVISEGIFKNFGNAFQVTKDTSNNILVGTGRAWLSG